MDFSDLQQVAQKRLPRFLFDYVAGGALSEATLRRNYAALDAVHLQQRVLRDVDHIDLSANWFGIAAAMPVALGPIGIAGMNARRGEVQAAGSATAAGIPFCLSTVSVCSIEEVASEAASPWFQLYVMRDRGLMRDLIARAKAAGCPALILTVDMPRPGKRYRDFRSGLAGASGIAGSIRRVAQASRRPAWAWSVGLRGRPHNLGNVSSLLDGKSGLEDFLAWMNGNFDPTVTWRDVDEIRSLWTGPLIVKGIMDRDDAREAGACGADAIVVSNHGGRQLDGCRATAEVLPEVANAVGDRLTVFADGGVRSGLDVVRMLALGADGVWLGRVWTYALAAGGGREVKALLERLAQEIATTMALCGITRIGDINSEMLAGKRSAG